MIEKEMFCHLIRQERRKQGLTQEALADAVKVHRTYICAIEKGRRFPSWEVMWNLAEVLKIEI